jgi:thioredoxin reductase (NADPH)
MVTGDRHGARMAEITDERDAQRFPKLTSAQIARIARHGKQRGVHAGDIVFEQGQENVGIAVVLSGAVEIVSPGMGGIDSRVTVHRAGQFTGDVCGASCRPTPSSATS